MECERERGLLDLWSEQLKEGCCYLLKWVRLRDTVGEQRMWNTGIFVWDTLNLRFSYDKEAEMSRKLKDMKRLELPGADGAGGVNSGVIILRRYWKS